MKYFSKLLTALVLGSFSAVQAMETETSIVHKTDGIPYPYMTEIRSVITKRDLEEENPELVKFESRESPYTKTMNKPVWNPHWA